MLAASSGALLALSLPGPDLGLLAWIALVPLLGALDGLPLKQAFRVGWLAGAVFFGFTLHWVFVLWPWTSLFIVPGYALLVGLLALSWGIFGALYAALSAKLPRGALLLAAPALWVVLEYLRSLTRFGFPWGQVADALYSQLPAVQVASIAGSWGVSFLAVLANMGLYLGLRARDWRYPAVALGVVGLTLLWGSWRLAQPLSQADGPELRVAIVQPNIPQRIKNDPRRLGEFWRTYQELLDEIAEQDEHVDLVILPESMLPTFVLDDPGVLDQLRAWAQQQKSAMLFGTFTQRGRQSFNSAVGLSPQGSVEGVYSKVQLVPFSTEYFPGIGLLKQLGVERWLPIGRLGTLTPGSGFTPLTVPVSLGEDQEREMRAVKVATPICFESIFARISQAFVREGAQLLVTITNDAWFGRSWALPQHFAKGVFRAVEAGRYFIQAANTGISGIIDPRGQILKRTQIEKRTVLVGTVRLLDSSTIYASLGDWLIYVSALILLGVGLWARLRSKASVWLG
jgi:apolipoprotein N-acyltransferase